MWHLLSWGTGITKGGIGNILLVGSDPLHIGSVIRPCQFNSPEANSANYLNEEEKAAVRWSPVRNLLRTNVSQLNKQIFCKKTTRYLKEERFNSLQLQW